MTDFAKPSKNNSILATAPGSEGYSLSLRYAAGGGGFSFRGFRKIEIRTAVRISLLCFFAVAPALMIAAENSETSPPTITFEDSMTKALVALITALTTWIVFRSREDKKAAEKVKVDIDRTPPLGEDTARTYATKNELVAVEGKLSSDIKDLRSQINTNDTTLRNLIEGNDKNAEIRSRGTHSRIDTLYRTQNKTNRSLGVLIGQLSVITKTTPKIENDDDAEG